ncbi:MAG TPA: hypothetical protein VN419_01460 [Humidesulfovibrio sp.]|uniref:hypothetical protein n=1 Tax=Humidesulfovibrio sp. TaxID=2910988 RepID=UPI002D0E5EFC|nr:hypothetical protein [Humidesulfovibrio sp.]HWR02657.1 hypothetical protein [Humidesulfovibrio sp.]
MKRFYCVARQYIFSDTFILCLIFCFSALFGGAVYLKKYETASFYQSEFAPAVFEASGYGFINASNIAELDGFLEYLNRKTARFNGVESNAVVKAIPLDALQASSRYLMGAAALCWSILGISWLNLFPLAAALCSLTAVASFLLARHFLGKLLAIAVTAIFITSPANINHLSDLRDYSKAPFMMFGVLFLIILVKDRLSLRRFLGVCVAAGACVGIGICFRMDLLILIPAFFFTLFLLTPYPITKFMQWKLAGGLLFIGAFIAFGFPSLAAFGKGSNAFHVIVLGLMPQFTSALGVSDAEVYQVAQHYNDMFALIHTSIFASRGFGAPDLQLATSSYDHFGMLFLLSYSKLFPADVLTRVFGAVSNIITTLPIYNFNWLSKLLPAIFMFILIRTTGKSLRLGLALVCLILFLCGYPALQFWPRHYFFLELISLLAVTVIIQLLIHFSTKSMTVLFRQGGRPQASGMMDYLRGSLAGYSFKNICILLVIFAAMSFGLFITRRLQQQNLAAYLTQYENLPQISIDLKTIDSGSDITIYPVDSFYDTSSSHSHQAQYWSLEIDPRRFDTTIAAPSYEILYHGYTRAFDDFSEKILIDTTKPTRHVFYTLAFKNPEGLPIEFYGIRIPKALAPAITNFSRLQDDPSLPILLQLTFFDGWQRSPLYQQLK